jgi:hypothetical protein
VENTLPSLVDTPECLGHWPRLLLQHMMQVYWFAVLANWGKALLRSLSIRATL